MPSSYFEPLEVPFVAELVVLDFTEVVVGDFRVDDDAVDLAFAAFAAA